MKHALKKQDMSHFPIDQIKQAPENESIYDNFGVANSDDWQLVESIRGNGILEPLVISADSVLLSGHRRRAAARRLCPLRRTESAEMTNGSRTPLSLIDSTSCQSSELATPKLS